jgi:hypothetical protein
MTLIEFLLARIAEDEALAIAARDAPWHDGWDGLVPEDWRLFREFSPTRVLAECKAKRRIVEWCTEKANQDELIFGEVILREMVQPYATHPGYHKAWA